MVRTCFIQTHYTDLADNDPNHYSIALLKQSKLFDHIVLAAADIPENHIVTQRAEEWGIASFLGAVDDIIQRMASVAKKTNADMIVRVLSGTFYLDMPLLEKMIEFLETENADYVRLPYDFDLKFTGDVLSANCILKVQAHLLDNPSDHTKFKFRPWFYIEDNGGLSWKVVDFKNTPEYSNDYFFQLRDDIDARCPLAKNYGTTFYYHEYEFASKLVQRDHITLDLACGLGAGTALIAKYCKHAIGIDLRPDYIETAKKRHDSDNITFLVGDGQHLDLEDNSIDLVVSAHTMEHVPDDTKFLLEIRRVLKPNGKLVIEVPLRVARPFTGNSNPFMKDHVREYTTDGLIELTKNVFHIDQAYGVNRGYYTDIDKARNAAMLICCKTDPAK